MSQAGDDLVAHDEPQALVGYTLDFGKTLEPGTYPLDWGGPGAIHSVVIFGVNETEIGDSQFGARNLST